MMKFPDSRTFAFTMFDDTDDGTVQNLKPVYDLLRDHGIKTTKSVWVYPPRGTFTGGCLLDDEYLAFIRGLQDDGFEIGLHNVGDGAFSRDEIAEGLEIFNNLLGHYPIIHTNHVSNIDNIYGGAKRFTFPLSAWYGTLSKLHRGRGVPRSLGDEPTSKHFWGDLAKQHIKYQRNLTFNDVNTLRCDPKMPYRVKAKGDYANHWFSSSDGHTIDEILHLLRDENLDRLEESGGVCIAYTHLAYGFTDSDNRLIPAFRERIENLARRNGWFAPVSTVLDHLKSANDDDGDPGYAYRLRSDMRWLSQRVSKRFRFGR